MLTREAKEQDHRQDIKVSPGRLWRTLTEPQEEHTRRVSTASAEGIKTSTSSRQRADYPVDEVTKEDGSHLGNWNRS